MVKIGQNNTLQVVKILDFGLYLDGGELGEILLPIRYVSKDSRVGDNLDVFIYRDSEDIIIATTDKPYAKVGDIANLRVVSVNEHGAFLYWGLVKDLFVPKREQLSNMLVGNYYPVYIYMDKTSERITGTAKINRFLQSDSSVLKERDEVDIIVYDKTDLGLKVLINKSFQGLIHNNDIFQILKIGTETKGYVKKIREDGKIDITLQAFGYNKVVEKLDPILEKLKENNGFLAVNDNSSPEEISELFGISKKTFKKAIGSLYKQDLITISDDGIRLV